MAVGELPIEEKELDGFNSFLSALDCDSSESNLPKDVLEQIKAGMQKRFDKPPTEVLEAVLRRTVSDSKARELLFYPAAEDMGLYPQLLAAPPAGAPDTHPQAKAQVLALTALYLVHARCWERVKPFIEAGGLMRLVDILAHPNLYLASQAMNCLLHVTDEAMFPWHDPPSLSDARSVREGPDGVVWKRMYDMGARSPLIPHLLRHQNPDTFPGSGLLALRLLAFVSSWLRYHFTPERILRLSQPLLDLLQEWSARATASEEEKTLAGQLHADFSRFPPAQAPVPQLGSTSDQTTLDDGEEEEGGVRVVADRTCVTHVEPSQQEGLRLAGNDAYRGGDLTLAIRCYSQALDVPVPAADLPTEGPRRAVVLANRAAAYLARADKGGGKPGDVDDSGLLEGTELGPQAVTRHYEAALLDAQGALDLDATNLKAHLRKAQALHKLGRQQEALKAVQEGQARAQRAADEDSNSKEAAAAHGLVSSFTELQSKVQHSIRVDNATPVTAPRPQQQQRAPASAGKGGVQQPQVVDIQDLPRQVAASRAGEGEGTEKEQALPQIVVPGSKPSSKPGSKSHGPLIQVVASSEVAEGEE